MNVPKASETALDTLKMVENMLEKLDNVESASPSLLGGKSLKSWGYSLRYL